MVGMNTEQERKGPSSFQLPWHVVPIGIALLIWLAFFCFYHPDCSICQFMEGFS